MKILVLHYYKSIVDGVMTSLIDGFFNMRENLLKHELQLKIFCPELYLMDFDDYYNIPLKDTQLHEYINRKGTETFPLPLCPYDDFDFTIDMKIRADQVTTSVPFLRFNRNFSDFELYYFIETEQRKYNADIIVCSARLIYEIMMGQVDIELNCKRLVVLDSLDTYKSKIGIFPDFDDYFDTLKDTKITQLSNPATFRDSKYEQKEYYHKFSERRLGALEQCDRFTEEYVFTRMNKDKTKINDDGYFENIGKGIFERLWCGKSVYYTTNGMFTKDGLWYYLKLFDIDADKDQAIKLTREEIKEKLFYRMWDGLHLGAYNVI